MERLARAEQWIAVALVALAALLRLGDLGQTPSCLEYDEAANVILAGEIARGEALPVFIRPYTGKEALYFYLAAGVMRFAGVTPFALRLTSAGLGILNVALTYWFTRQLLTATGIVPHGAWERAVHWLPLYSAALVAVSYWQVHLSRFGYRAIALPPLLALTCGSLLQALRTGRPVRAAIAGAWAGLSAYTYSSVRALPILLLVVWAWATIADRRRWRLRLAQFALFGLAALVVFAPLGAFFLRSPEAFSVRLAQVSVLSPAVNQGDLWGTLWRTVRLALGMFTRAGDLNPLYNAPGKPVFDRVVGPAFYLGLLVCLWLVVRRRGASQSHKGELPSAPHAYPRLPYVLLLAWLPVMMVPNVLSASGVPHNLRAMALVPAVFVFAALGLVTALHWVARLVARSPARQGLLLTAVLIGLLAHEGLRTHGVYRAWAASPDPYYKGNEALIGAAALLNAHPEADAYVATYFQQHATLAVYARDYQQIRWLSGSTLVLPPPGARPAILVYDHTMPVDPLLREQYLAPQTLIHREYGPDGEVGFEAYRLEADTRPAPHPHAPMDVNLGNTLTLLGYDLNAPPISGAELDVTLYLEVQRTVTRDDLTLFAHLVDDLGFRWAEATFFHYPPAQWRPGEVAIYRLRLPIAVGAPPDAYTLHVGVFSPSADARLPVLNESGQMAGTVALAGPIAVAPAGRPASTLPPMQARFDAQFGDAIVLLGADRDRSDLLPGQTLALTLYWRALAAIEGDPAVRVVLSGPAGEVVLWDGHPVHGRYPFRDWESGALVRDRYALRLPIDVAAGDWELLVSVVDGAGRPLPTAQGGSAVVLGTIHVQATDRLWEPPLYANPVGARLGAGVELLGYDLDRAAAEPGDTLHLTLIWRCRASMDEDYTVFTHLLDPGGQVRGQKDNPPRGGGYPTTLWLPGEIIVDPYAIQVAVDAPPGAYAIEVGMYNPADMQRLPVIDPGGAAGDRVLLGQVEVRPAR
ncbi:MAG: hypothetical protein JXA09_09590 [Anaerolineae bacterium]|nr:hypothetical protein [Anaerolineae bacterium]